MSCRPNGKRFGRNRPSESSRREFIAVLLIVFRYFVSVTGHPRKVPAHLAYTQHQHRWQTQSHVRHDRHQRYRQTFFQHRVEKGRRRPEQEGWRMYRRRGLYHDWLLINTFGKSVVDYQDRQHYNWSLFVQCFLSKNKSVF